MKYAVTIAKDMTPYFHIEAEADEDPADARQLAEDLRDAFAGYKEGEEPPERPRVRAEVVD